VVAAAAISVIPVDPSFAGDQINLDDPARLMQTIAPERVQAQDDDASVTASAPDSDSASAVTFASWGGRNSLAVEVPAELEYQGERDGYQVFIDDVGTRATYLSTNLAGGQIEFASTAVEHVTVFEVALPSFAEATLQPADEFDGTYLERGDSALLLGNPVATDASGHSLPSRFEFTDGHVRLLVDTANANSYPILTTLGWSYTLDYGIGRTTPAFA
jgi:hypothetical protein